MTDKDIRIPNWSYGRAADPCYYANLISLLCCTLKIFVNSSMEPYRDTFIPEHTCIFKQYTDSHTGILLQFGELCLQLINHFNVDWNTICHCTRTSNTSVEKQICCRCPDVILLNRGNMTIIKMIPVILFN